MTSVKTHGPIGETGPDVEIVAVRLDEELITVLDAWIARQPQELDRSEAIRLMVATALDVLDLRN